MGLSNLISRISSLVNRGSQYSSVRADGGTSCYRPVKKKDRNESGNPEQGEYPADQQIPYAHTGFTDMNPPMDPGPVQDRRFYPAEETSQAGMNNISYMPGVYAPDAGSSYTHVEHIMTMTSMKSCYDAIECMKDGETLIISLEAIANESEALRCQDMLAGAAFTLGCTVRALPSARMVLIAPGGVKILPEQTQPRQEIMPPAYMYDQAPARQDNIDDFRRERRVSQRTEQWTAARNGELNGYNPYTGTMPAAAGAYSSYGGFGY